MLHIIEVGSEVKIDDAGFPLINRLGHSVYRFMRCPFRSISIRPRLEISFEDRFQDELECAVHYTIAECGHGLAADFVAPVLLYLFLPCSPGRRRYRVTGSPKSASSRFPRSAIVWSREHKSSSWN